MEPKTDLNTAVRKLVAHQSPESRAEFSVALKALAESGTWVYMPGKKEEAGFSFAVLTARGKNFAAFYSDPSEVPPERMQETCVADLDRLISQVFREQGLAGVVIDPFTHRLCLEKHALLRCLLHGGYPALESGGTEPKNWGDGIPEYTQADLMTPAEIQNFAIHSVIEHDENLRKGYTFVSGCDYPGAMPSLILEKDGRFVFVYLKSYTASDEPVLTPEERGALLKLAEKYSGASAWAPVGFFSAEPDRFSAGLTLRGDGFFCRYEGLRSVDPS